MKIRSLSRCISGLVSAISASKRSLAMKLGKLKVTTNCSTKYAQVVKRTNVL
jgi:hypothetical protein